jgi:alpha-D-xyloside xylohydrolase
MIKQHTFNVVLVNGAHGANTAAADKTDKTVVYSGSAMSVKI